MEAEQEEIDRKQREVFAKALRELGFDPEDFPVDIAPAAPISRAASPISVAAPHLKRKTVTLHRVSTERSHEYETYVGATWAAELLQAVLHGRLNE